MADTATQTATGAGKLQELQKDSEFSGLLDKAVGQMYSEKAAEDGKQAVTDFIKNILDRGDYIWPEDFERTIKIMIADYDRRLSEQINLVIHHSDFQKLEGTWRGLHHLVYKTEVDETLKLRVMNLSKKDLSKNLEKFPDTAFDQSPLFKNFY